METRKSLPNFGINAGRMICTYYCMPPARSVCPQPSAGVNSNSTVPPRLTIIFRSLYKRAATLIIIIFQRSSGWLQWLHRGAGGVVQSSTECLRSRARGCGGSRRFVCTPPDVCTALPDFGGYLSVPTAVVCDHHYPHCWVKDRTLDICSPGAVPVDSSNHWAFCSISRR